MKIPFIAGIVAGLTIGMCTTYLVMQVRSGPPATVQPPSPDPKIPVDAPFAEGFVDLAGGREAEHDGDELLSKLSGAWTSIDGQINADLDFRMLRFKAAPDWQDLENQTFLLGSEMDFLSSRGVYLIQTRYSEPDEMWFCLEDEVTEDLTSFTLFREGSPKAGSRTPIPRGEPPQKVRDLLRLIPLIRAGELKDTVLERCGLGDLDGFELLGGEGGLGETDLILALGIDDHWMLSIGYRRLSPDDESKAVLRTFKLFQGYVDDVREGLLELERVAFPYYDNGKIITGPSQAEQASSGQPASRSESNSEGSDKLQPEAEGRSR
jgi:hypothetical protein